MARLLAETPPGSAPDRLAALLRHRARLVGEDRSLACVTRLGSELNVRTGPGSTYAGFQDLAPGLIADLVREGQARREFRAGLHPEGVARAVFASIVGIDALSLLSSGGEDLGERSEELIDLILPGLVGPPAGQQDPQGNQQDPQGKEPGNGPGPTH